MDSREEHDVAMKYLCMYMKKIQLLRLHFKLDPSKGFECYADADFATGFICHFTIIDLHTAKSYTGWYVFLCWMFCHLGLQDTILDGTKQH